MKFYFCLKHGTAAETALVDSGATENFLDHDTAKCLGITPKELPIPRIMNNVDRTTNQTRLVKHFYDFRLKMGEQETIQRFYVKALAGLSALTRA